MKASPRTHGAAAAASTTTATATTDPRRARIATRLLLLAGLLLACTTASGGCDAFQNPISLMRRGRRRGRHAMVVPDPPPNPTTTTTTTTTRLGLGRSDPDAAAAADDFAIAKRESGGNPFASLLASILPGLDPPAPAETKEQREARLERERTAELARLEAERLDRIRTDAPAYVLLLALQLLPLVGTDKWVNKLYFLGTAITTVYVGSRQKTVFAPETVSKKSALGAPIGASIAIGFLYALIKSGFDPTTVYAVLVTIYGILGIADVGAPLLKSLPGAEGFPTVPVPDSLAGALGAAGGGEEDRHRRGGGGELPLPTVLAPVLGILATAVYWSPALAIEQKFLVSNLIAWSIGMASLGVISLGSFQTGAILLGGLFFYDIFFVFGTDVMMTVALKIEAPVKLLYPAPPSDVPREYPFSVLGLGDVVIPGLFVRFMTKLDEQLRPAKLSYATGTTIAYGVGLAVCFVANEVTGSGQPALLYLNPACVGTALACGVVNDQLRDVWAFEDAEAAARPNGRYARDSGGEN